MTEAAATQPAYPTTLPHLIPPKEGRPRRCFAVKDLSNAAGFPPTGMNLPVPLPSLIGAECFCAADLPQPDALPRPPSRALSGPRVKAFQGALGPPNRAGFLPSS